MAITGISSIDNKQIIAAGALSAISANQALITSGGDSLQGLYDTVSTNSGSWTGGGGGSVTSPSGTIIVNGSNIEATNSAVGTIVTPSASALLGNNVNINGPWDPSPSVFNFTLPTSGGTLYAVRTTWYVTDYLNFSGKASNGDITTGTITVGENPGTYTADLNEIVSDLSAQGTQSNVRMEHFYVTSPSASNSGVYELAWKKDVPTGQFFTGYNTFTSGSTSYSAVIDTDYKLTAGIATYSLIGAYTNANNKFNKLTGSNTLFEYSGYYEMGNIAYKPDVVGTINANSTDASLLDIFIEFRFNEWPVTSKIDKVYLTFDATQSGTVNDSKWKLLSRNNNHYEFVKYYPLSEDNPAVIVDRFTFNYNSWGTITNATASADIYSAFDIKELAFKDDLTGGSVPDEVMSAASAVSANSANWNETTDTLSANSGAWGGSALPISAGPGIKFDMVDNTLVANTDETVLFFAGNDSSGVQAGNLTESIMNFERIRVAGMDNDGHVDVKYIYPAWTKNADNFDTTGYEVMLYGANPVNNTVWEKWTRYSFSALTSFNVVLSYEGSYTANTISNVTNSHKNSVREVVGINRIAGGN